MKKIERASVAALLLGLLTFTPPAALALEAERWCRWAAPSAFVWKRTG